LATDGHPATNTKRQQIAIAVMPIALSFGTLGTKLLGLLAQSTVESLFVCLLVWPPVPVPSFEASGFSQPGGQVWFGLVCYAATQLATQLPQRRIQVVRSNKVARKRLTESNGTPAMDFGHTNVVLNLDIRVRRYTNKRGREQKPNA